MIFLLNSLLNVVSAQSGSNVRCTFHDYEGMSAQLGLALDNSPGWCGTRYSVLNVARVTAVNGMGAGLCNQCLEITGSNGGPAVYVLAIDNKADPGLDVARSSFQALFPSANAYDPQLCNWRVVEPSRCGTICTGSAEECTPGVRNLLPAYLLPASRQAAQGLTAGSVTQRQAAPAAAAVRVASTVRAQTTHSSDIQKSDQTQQERAHGAQHTTARPTTTTHFTVTTTSVPEHVKTTEKSPETTGAGPTDLPVFGSAPFPNFGSPSAPISAASKLDISWLLLVLLL